MTKQIDIPDTKECVHSHVGMWACESVAFQAMYQRALDGNLPMLNAMELDEKKSSKVDFEIMDGIAVIPMIGASQKAESKFEDSFSTVRVRKMIRQARDNDKVRGIMLFINSPGGTVSGQNELGIEIDKASKVKPLRAYGEDLVASAAMWSASQADGFSCNPTAQVGCIGTYSVVYDFSGKMEKDGIKVHLIATGDYKGAGTPGTEITEKQLKEWQKNTDLLNEFFLNAVSDGREISMANLKNIADGRCFIAAEALELGLVDKIESWDEAMMNFADSIDEAEINQLETKKQERVMENKQVILFAQVFGNERGMDYMKREMSFEEAATEHIAMQSDALAVLETEKAETATIVSTLTAKNEELSKDVPLEPDNGKPPADEKAEEVDPIKAWETAVSAKAEVDGCTKGEASMALIESDPELYSDFVQTFNK